MKHFFVTGTDTDIGKTVVSAMLTLGLDARYWKPIQSGLEEKTDTEKVMDYVGEERIIPEAYRLNSPLSPHHSAEIDKIQIEMDKIERPSLDGPLIIEGAGGLLVPINDEFTIVDVIKKMEIPVILVARSQLGTLNHTLLSLNELRKHNIAIAGVIMNGPNNLLNKTTIERWGKVKVLLELEPSEDVSKEFLLQKFNEMELP
ncbi:MAG: dethiobiotin synthase [Bdellovibrionales bacterium]|nr:dethiobiotin synthase [Bdellovibrionales bacterium]